MLLDATVAAITQWQRNSIPGGKLNRSHLVLSKHYSLVNDLPVFFLIEVVSRGFRHFHCGIYSIIFFKDGLLHHPFYKRMALIYSPSQMFLAWGLFVFRVCSYVPGRIDSSLLFFFSPSCCLLFCLPLKLWEKWTHILLWLLWVFFDSSK